MGAEAGMVERVARAITKAYGWSNDDESWEAFTDEARAAIAAMREPTEGMRKAVEKAENDMGVCHAAYEHIDWDEAWPVAIDAALEDTK
jgi:cytochrome c556